MKKILIIFILTTVLLPVQAQEEIDITRKPAPMQKKEFSFPEHKEAVLNNGLKLFIVEDHEQPVVSLRLHIAGGTSMDSEKPGTAEITSDMLLKGYGEKKASEIAAILDGIGAEISVNAGTDAITVNASCLKKHFPAMMEIFSNMVINPSFPAREFKKLIPRYQAYLQQRKGTPHALASDMTKIVQFGKEHPYATRMTEESLEKIEVNDLKYFHNTFFKPNNATLAIIGDVEPVEIVSTMQTYFKNWKLGKVPEIQIPPASPMPLGVYFIPRRGSVQSSIFISTEGLPYTHPDYRTLDLAADVIGAGFAGRLFRTLRETYSYTYTPFGSLTSNKFLNYFVCGADVRTGVTDSAINVINEQLTRLATQEPSEEELTRVKRTVVGGYLMNFENSNFIASLIQRAYFYGIPLKDVKDYPETVMGISPYEIKTTANKYMNPANEYIIVVGLSEIKENLAEFGNISEYSLDLEPLTGIHAKLDKADLNAEELLAKYTDALGGKEALDTVKTMLVTAETQFMMQGNNISGEIISKYEKPHKMYKKLKLSFREQETWSDGSNVWTKSGTMLEKTTGGDSISTLHEATLFLETKLPEMGYKCKVLGKQNGMILMRASAPFGKDIIYYFDAESYLLKKSEYTEQSEPAPMQITEKIISYGTFGGLTLPEKKEIQTPMFTIKNNLSYEINPVFEENIFKPGKSKE